LRDPANLPVLSKDRLRYIVAQIDPTFKLENDVEEMMLEIADDFITRVATKACKLAKHRKSIRVAVRDARIPLEQDWSIRVPGFGAEPPE
ncbi:transcription initiation factor TFIID subunit A-domain-containing protein, partial [Geranomyces variabilis]